MRIKSIQVENYKSFLKSNVIEFTSGFNVIVGKNNSGKTALAEMLSLQFENKPHISMATKPTSNSQYHKRSDAHAIILLQPSELLEIFKNYFSDSRFFIHSTKVEVDQQVSRVLQSLNETNLVKITIENGAINSAQLQLSQLKEAKSEDQSLQFRFGRTDELPIFDQRVNHKEYNNTARTVAEVVKSRIYKFNAERLNISEATISPKRILSPDASNLPSVLHEFHSRNPDHFREINKYINQIFPDIYQVITPILSGNSVFIALRAPNIDISRGDLNLSLSESGTGIGQVLAILYVVLTSEYPRTIIIDEPQSFLHPGAVRKLFSILQTDFTQHQYIITTHSPTAVTSANPETILLVRKHNSISNVETIDTSKNEELELFLSDVGVRLSDVFGVDNILWVEGVTEEKCFPIILTSTSPELLRSTKILGVLHTGDFEGRFSKSVFEIYERLSESTGLLPPAIGFIFDQEGRTKTEEEDLIRQSKGEVRFLGRRLYENYLLNIEAISHVLTKNSGESINSEQITEWLDEHKWDKAYFNKREVSENKRTDTYWLEKIHGAKLLHDIFSQLPNSECRYQKTKHSVELTEWLIENSPEDLREIADLLANIIHDGQHPAE